MTVDADSLTMALDETTAATPIALRSRTHTGHRPVALRDEVRSWQRAKRVGEPIVALVLLLILLPLLLIVAAAIKLDSRGPALFRQRRVGLGLTEFNVFKFRTMVHNAPEELHRAYIAQLVSGDGETADDGELKKMTDDPRITRIGRFLRRTSLDELPQLINVVTGQMSLVGPRPAIAYELEHYEERHFGRFSVRPGLTGLWQVSGRNELSFGDMLDLDVRYAQESGPAKDLQILARTPMILVRKTAA
jgi:lipopolysaccharide/colanic/teichoic acid biosynthesis glycosyltransferase